MSWCSTSSLIHFELIINFKFIMESKLYLSGQSRKKANVFKPKKINLKFELSQQKRIAIEPNTTENNESSTQNLKIG